MEFSSLYGVYIGEHTDVTFVEGSKIFGKARCSFLWKDITPQSLFADKCYGHDRGVRLIMDAFITRVGDRLIVGRGT